MTMIQPPDPNKAIDTFRKAAELNLGESMRDGSTVRLPGYGQAVMTGDLHGHKKNFDKLTKYAMLDRVAARHVILHEMVHAELDPRYMDHSHELLLMAAEYKCEYPEQVHFLQSNHELAQLTGYPIAKNGRAVIDDYNHTVELTYGAKHAKDVLAAMNAFIASFALAVCTENRIWMSHSLPNTYDMVNFDPSIFSRTLTLEDLQKNQTIFSLVWGRRHNQEHIDKLAGILNADVFITGHQPQEMGFTMLFDRLIILASDHNHGTFLPFDLSKRQTAEELVRNIRKFVAIT
ncbi:MAG: hypothetical protein HZA51_18775 [Planctomycetes bacterium]|nr:hypothetical protein [Planctomycetota bacterium]